MKKNRITIQFVGSAFDQKDVRLEDFIDQLSRIKKALNEAEMSLSGLETATIDYKIVGLRHHSPSTVVLEPIQLNGRPPVVELPEVPIYFAAELQSIKRDAKLLRAPDLSRLEAYMGIGMRSIRRRNSVIDGVKISVQGKTVTIDQKFKENLSVIVGPDEVSEGSISGMLEALNIHNTNRFTLYPSIGPGSVKGTFPAHLRPQIKQGLECFVTISGSLKFKAWSELPHAIFAEAIDIHEPDSDLPKLAEMRGAFSGIIGDSNSAEFVDGLRINEGW